MAKLLDTVAQREVNGERDYGEGAAAVASAMAWESKGEELGANGCVHGVRGATWRPSRPARRREEEAGRRAAGWRALLPPSSTCLPAWPSQAARWSGSWAGPAGGLVGHQVTFLSRPFLFLFCFITFATLFN